MRPHLMCTIGAALLGLAMPARAQIYEVLTDAQIAQAITQGTAKDDPVSDLTTLSQTAGWSTSAVSGLGRFSTPFVRVLTAARDAHVNFRPFTRADVTPEMLAPELHVYAFPITVGAGARDVTQVVITPRKGNDAQKRAAAILPSRLEPLPVQYKNLFGAAFEGEGRIAVFPLSALTDAHEVRFVYEGGTTSTARFRLLSPSRRHAVH